MSIFFSRHEDTTPVKCKDCGWQGTVADSRHGYDPIYPDDVEPTDFCPECGSRNLVEIEEDLVPA